MVETIGQRLKRRASSWPWQQKQLNLVLSLSATANSAETMWTWCGTTQNFDCQTPTLTALSGEVAAFPHWHFDGWRDGNKSDDYLQETVSDSIKSQCHWGLYENTLSFSISVLAKRCFTVTWSLALMTCVLCLWQLLETRADLTGLLKYNLVSRLRRGEALGPEVLKRAQESAGEYGSFYQSELVLNTCEVFCYVLNIIVIHSL